MCMTYINCLLLRNIAAYGNFANAPKNRSTREKSLPVSLHPPPILDGRGCGSV
jgi:hypothetical protein